VIDREDYQIIKNLLLLHLYNSPTVSKRN
jgi:hypothetical protein